jgi:excisionase family DNA binding protein
MVEHPRLLLNDADASKVLSVSRAHFHKLVSRGEIPRVKLGRCARYRVTDLEAFIERYSPGVAGYGAE